MKAVVIFVLLAVPAQLTNADKINNFEDDLLSKFAARSAIGNKIKEFLESFKETMKTGDESMGIPQMDPFNLKHQEFNLDHELVTALGEINNLQVEGLSDFQVEDADFKLAKKNFSIKLMWPNIKGNTLYNIIEAKIMDYLPIFGTGDAKFEATKLNFGTNAKVKLDMKNKNLTILEFSNTKISLDALKLEANGLYDDEEYAVFISDLIGKIAPKFLIEFQEELVAEIDKIMLEFGNQLLSSFSDVIWGTIMP